MRPLIALLVAVLVVVSSRPASASAPVVETFEYSGTIVDSSLCGFPIALTFTGTFTTRLFFDKSGAFVMAQVHAPDVATAVSSRTGRTVTGHEVLNIHFDAASFDESRTGIPLHFNGLIVDAGRIFLGGDGTVRIDGRHQLIEGDLTRFCAAMS